MKNICYLETADDVISVLCSIRSKDNKIPFMNPATHQLVLQSGQNPVIRALDDSVSEFMINENVTNDEIVTAAFKAIDHLTNVHVDL